MFTIRFETVAHRPDLQVTIRSSVDGWDDVAGDFEGDAWNFQLDTPRYAAGFDFKFVLEEQYWMSGPNLNLVPVDGQTYTYGDGQVAFPPMTEVVKENSRVQQLFFPPNLDENRLWDVIVVGSGIGGGIVADQLADTGLDVLVLEAGSYLFPTHVGNLPRQHIFGPRVDKNIWHLWDEFRVTNYRNTPGSLYAGARDSTSAVAACSGERSCPG